MHTGRWCGGGGGAVALCFECDDGLLLNVSAANANANI
jgi:hypothetical protein